MASSRLALLSGFPFAQERKIFRRRAILHIDACCTVDGRTVDVSYRDINLIVDRPLEIGAATDLRFNITVDQKTVLLAFNGRIASCILVGMNGYRIRFEIDTTRDHACSTRLAGLMDRLR
ncbi:hypothetical protein [uncultured Oxalicibacterium sp.]|uniref:hypothetical protein n=1 Tax=uncultured Oxalicibacterium sp. TaxID=1168540 RepID=UPI0025F5D689|nr:hypothetical protein [uncultured Oxalicibacterium sp.]